MPASSIQTITWNSTGTVGNVSLRYSLDGGANWDWVRNPAGTIANNIANTGSFEWMLPSDKESSKGLIQLYEYSKTCNIDYSDNFFSVNNNSIITVALPNGGEKVYTGRSYSIT